jgi:glycosyltransferase involved in cell wall biosynthesis
MNIAIVTDVWHPHAHAAVEMCTDLVQSLVELGPAVTVLHPGEFRSRPAPAGWSMDWALMPAKRMSERLDELAPDVLHLASEGPLGWAARQWALSKRQAFTTANWVDLPLWLGSMSGCPQCLGAAWQRWFHRPSAAVIVPCPVRAQRLTQQYGVQGVQLWTPGVDIRRFVFVPEPVPNRWLGALPRPVSLCVVHEGMTLEVVLQAMACGTPVARRRHPDDAGVLAGQVFGGLSQTTCTKPWRRPMIFVHHGDVVAAGVVVQRVGDRAALRVKKNAVTVFK